MEYSLKDDEIMVRLYVDSANRKTYQLGTDAYRYQWNYEVPGDATFLSYTGIRKIAATRITTNYLPCQINSMNNKFTMTTRLFFH